MVLLHLIIDCTLYQSNHPESDLHSNEHYLSSSENKTRKKIQACMGFEPMTFIYLQSFSNYTINNYNFEQEELLWFDFDLFCLFVFVCLFRFVFLLAYIWG